MRPASGAEFREVLLPLSPLIGRSLRRGPDEEARRRRCLRAASRTLSVLAPAQIGLGPNPTLSPLRARIYNGRQEASVSLPSSERLFNSVVVIVRPMSPFLGLADVLFHPDDSLDPVTFEILKQAVGEVAGHWRKSQDEAEDLLHDLLVKLLENRPDDVAEGRQEAAVVDRDRLFSSCLAVARNHLIDEHRKGRRLRAEDPTVLDARAGPDRATGPEQEVDLKLIGHPKSEEVIRLLLHEGLSVRDVAGMMRLTERRVRGLRLLGLRRLHTRYTRDSADHPG